MKQRLSRLLSWYQSRERRERIVLAIGVAAVGVTLLYLVLWEPVTKAHARRLAELDQARELAGRIEALAVQGGGRAFNSARRNLSLLTVVDQSAKSGTLNRPFSRLQPEGDAEVRVWLEGVSFDALMRWIVQLQVGDGVIVKTAQIDRSQTPGTVNAQLSLIRP